MKGNRVVLECRLHIAIGRPRPKKSFLFRLHLEHCLLQFVFFLRELGLFFRQPLEPEVHLREGTFRKSGLWVGWFAWIEATRSGADARNIDLPVVELEGAALDGRDLRGVEAKEEERIRAPIDGADVLIREVLAARQAARVGADDT